MDSPDSSQLEEVEGKSVNVSKCPKRKAERTASDNEVLQPPKMSMKELYKAPTVEEFNQLKEAENLFHCNLLKMQVMVS